MTFVILALRFLCWAARVNGNRGIIARAFARRARKTGSLVIRENLQRWCRMINQLQSHAFSGGMGYVLEIRRPAIALQFTELLES